jgi:dihydrofolate reductase
MRKIIVFNRVTADGYFASATGGLDWAVPDAQVDREAAENMPMAGAMLLGRKTYELFESYWPHAADEDPHAAGRRNESIRQMAQWINQAEKLVVSRTRQHVTWQGSRLLSSFDPEEIQAIKQGEGKDIMVFGSGSVVAQLSQHGLVDEYRFLVTPLLLGQGRSMLRDLPLNVRLELREVKQYDSGNVMLCYACAQQS